MFLQALSSRDNHKNVATERVNTSINNHEYRKTESEAAPDSRQSCSFWNLSRSFCSWPSPVGFRRELKLRVCGSGLELHAHGTSYISAVSAASSCFVPRGLQAEITSSRLFVPDQTSGTERCGPWPMKHGRSGGSGEGHET